MSEQNIMYEGGNFDGQMALTEPVMPSLQLDGLNEQPLVVSAKPVKQVNPYGVTLTESEKQAVVDFSKKIDLTNPNVISNYGVGAQSKMAEFSDTILSTVKTKDTGSAGELISKLISEIDNFDASCEPKKGIAKIFSNAKRETKAMIASYNTVEANIETIKKSLERSVLVLMKDVTLLEGLYRQNDQYLREITMYILAGKMRIEEVRTSLLPLYQSIADSGNPYDVQKLKDLQDQLDRFEKRIYDLELTRQIVMQTSPQIRLLQNNDNILIEKINSTFNIGIPLWKSRMVIALGLEHAKDAAAVQAAVTSTINRLLESNAEQLKMSSIDIAKASEQGIVDIETIKKTNQLLISTISEVLAVQVKGRQDRAQAEKELEIQEQNLKQALIGALNYNAQPSTMQDVYEMTPTTENSSFKLHL